MILFYLFVFAFWNKLLYKMKFIPTNAYRGLVVYRKNSFFKRLARVLCYRTYLFPFGLI